MQYDINAIFSAQQASRAFVKARTATARIAKLRRLKACIMQHEQLLYEALAKDLRKSEFEAAVTEVIFIYGEIDFAIGNLSSWMKPLRVGRTLSNPFARNRIYHEPKGLCLIISPWNYPFQLCMSPLVSAIAAGNCAILKPSELSPATSALIAQIIAACFDSGEICCVQGGAELSGQLLQLPFDHIFFTGSTAVGKVVMEAAAKNLASVTLELGGKSPVIVDASADLEKAAVKIAWGKLINAGQTCIAPDYLLIHESVQDAFIAHYIKAVQTLFYDTNDKPDAASYAKIINLKHFNRLCALIDDATTNGAKIEFGGHREEENRVIAPVLLSGLAVDAKLMREEIFGPILPVLVYASLDEALAIINQKSKPLALYVFTRDKGLVKKILAETSAGGTCINDVLIHISNPKMPFGGTGHSGMGSCHGYYGFKAFSHERAVMFQSGLDFTRLIYPPYAGKEWVLKLLKKLMYV